MEEANKQLILIGELHLKYQEKLERLSSLRRTEVEMEMFKEACKEEMKGKFDIIDGVPTKKYIALKLGEINVLKKIH